MQSVEIIPSLLSADFAILADEIKKVERAKCKKLHLDIMDGHFVPNLTIGPIVIEAIRKRTDLYLQAHLMIDRPERYIDDFKQVGADGVIIHRGACCDFINTIETIKEMGMHAGIALRPKTPIDSIKDVIHKMDMVLIMTVEPGFGGQSFLPDMEDKIIQTKELLAKKGIDIPIGVDGGLNTQTIPIVVKAGARQLIAGNAVFENENVEKNIKILYKSIPERSGG